MREDQIKLLEEFRKKLVRDAAIKRGFEKLRAKEAQHHARFERNRARLNLLINRIAEP